MQMKIEKLVDTEKNQDDLCNEENKNPQKYALVEKLICREPMPNTMVMTTANSYPYRKKTYCGGLLEYEEPVDDYVAGPGPCKLCAEEPSNVKCYYCRRQEEMKDRPFSIPASPDFPGVTGVPTPAREPQEASGESGTQSIEPAPAPVVVSTASPLSSEYTAAGASLDVVPETPPEAAVGAAVGRTGSQADTDDKFVMYSPSKIPIKLERFSVEPGGARTSSVRDDSEPDEAAPPSKRARGGPLRAGKA